MCECVHGSVNERPCKEIKRREINGLFNHLIQRPKTEQDQHFDTGRNRLLLNYQQQNLLNHDLRI